LNESRQGEFELEARTHSGFPIGMDLPELRFRPNMLDSRLNAIFVADKWGGPFPIAHFAKALALQVVEILPLLVSANDMGNPTAV